MEMSDFVSIYLSGLLPFFALCYVFIIPLASDFTVATRTHCHNKNVLPSVSAAIGYSYQTTLLWFLCISIHTPFRFRMAKGLNNIYRKLLAEIYNEEFLIGQSLQELRKFKRLERLTKYSYWFNCLEIIGLLILSVFTSNTDYSKLFFFMWIIFNTDCFHAFIIDFSNA